MNEENAAVGPMNEAVEVSVAAPVEIKPLNLSLDSITVVDKSRLTVWVDYKDGISFLLSYVSKAEIARIANQCLKLVWSDKAKKREPSLDPELFAKKFAQVAVKDWKGATFNSISTMIPLDTAKVKKEDRDKEIAFSYDNLAACIQSSSSLDEFLQAQVTNPLTFRPDKDNEEGN